MTLGVVQGVCVRWGGGVRREGRGKIAEGHEEQNGLHLGELLED